MSRPGGFRNRPQQAPQRPGEGAPANRQRFDKPAISKQVTTLWDYPSQHYGDEEQGDKNYRGATPSYVIWNVVKRFTEEGDEVVDPFCGSGTTLDVCKELRRKGHGFDVSPARADVQNADARSIPIKNDKVQLVFMDPPYGDNLDYSDDPRCFGKLKAQGQWQRAMKLAIQEAIRVLKPEGVLAMFVCDILKKGKTFHPLGFDLFQIAREEGLFAIDVVSVVRHNRTLEMGNYRKAADEQNFFLRGFNYLLLFRKKAAVTATMP